MSAKAKRIKILDMLDGYSSLIGKDLTGLTNALCREAEPYPLDVVVEATQTLARTCQYPPTPADMFGACERYSSMLHPKVVKLYNGMISMDFGHGRIDMRGLTTAEQDAIIDAGGIIAGKNAALMSIEEKRAALKQIAAPETAKRIVKPTVRKM